MCKQGYWEFSIVPLPLRCTLMFTLIAEHIFILNSVSVCVENGFPQCCWERTHCSNTRPVIWVCFASSRRSFFSTLTHANALSMETHTTSRICPCMVDCLCRFPCVSVLVWIVYMCGSLRYSLSPRICAASPSSSSRLAALWERDDRVWCGTMTWAHTPHTSTPSSSPQHRHTPDWERHKHTADTLNICDAISCYHLHYNRCFFASLTWHITIHTTLP